MRTSWMVLAFAVLGCDEPVGEPILSVDGRWRIQYTDLTRPNRPELRCEVQPIEVSITQTGSTFSGAQVGTSSMTCFFQGGPFRPVGISSESLTEGRLTGSEVSFVLEANVAVHTGIHYGPHIAGEVQWFGPPSDLPLPPLAYVARFMAWRQ